MDQHRVATTHNPYAYEEAAQTASGSVSSIASLDGSDSGDEVEVGLVIKEAGFVYRVRMKHGRVAEFWVGSVIASPGTHVIVEVQRGYDLGVLEGEPLNVKSLAYPPPQNCRLIRQATEAEIGFWTTALTEAEEQARRTAQNVFAATTNTPITVVSTELQYDCRLLLVNYRSPAQFVNLKNITAKLLKIFNMRVVLSRLPNVQVAGR